jgi:hypothetical protein
LQKINLLLEDEKYRKRLGANAKKWGMTHWSLDKGVKHLIEIYKGAISKRGKDESNGASEPIN